MSLSPQVCKKNYKVHIPAMGEECEFWLVRVTDEQSITNPDKDHAYYTDDGKLFIYDGKNLVRVNCDICFTQEEREKLEDIEEGANKYVLPVANDSSLGGIKTGFTQTEKQYAVEVTEEGQAYVTVPWTDTVYTLPQADTDTLGGVKLGYSQNGKNYPVLKDENGNIYVAVPWVEYQLQQASAETLGGIKTGYEQQGQNYPVDVDVEGNAYVTVPWNEGGNSYYPATDQQLGLLMLGHQYTLGDFPLVFDSESRAYTQLPFSNPNLLDNADFKSGIINQRGNEEYNLGTGNTGNKPTIDRWIGNCTYVKPYDGYLYIKDNIDTAKAYLYQNLSSVCNGDYTVYINISSMRGGTLNLYFNGELSNKFTISGQGEHIYTFEGVSNQNIFALELDGFDGNIECIKLEKGSVYTGMPQWDETTELLKCMRYFQFTEINETIWSTQYDNQFEQNIMFTLPMIKTPSITTIMTDNYNVTNVSVVAKDNTRCSLRYTLDKSNGSGHRIGLRINADAETYS